MKTQAAKTKSKLSIDQIWGQFHETMTTGTVTC